MFRIPGPIPEGRMWDSRGSRRTGAGARTDSSRRAPRSLPGCEDRPIGRGRAPRMHRMTARTGRPGRNGPGRHSAGKNPQSRDWCE